MKREAREGKIEVPCLAGSEWDGRVESLMKLHEIPDGYYLSEVKRMGRRYTFVYLKKMKDCQA